MFRLTGYEWKVGGTKQVAYVGIDDHIHELYKSNNQAWKHADLTNLTGAPNVPDSSLLVGYEWAAGKSKQVVYTTGNGHIHELHVKQGGQWSHADLTQLAGAPPEAVGDSVAGYEWKAGGSKQVVYIGNDGHVHELFVRVNGPWGHADLSHLTGTEGLSISNVQPRIGYEWDAAGSKQVVFATFDGHLHEFFVSQNQGWKHADLTQLSGVPSKWPDDPRFVSGYQWPADSTKQVVFYPTASEIFELVVLVGGAWSHVTLTQFLPASFFNTGLHLWSFIVGYPWEAAGSKQVVFATDDGHIHELYIRKNEASWHYANLTQLAKAPNANVNAPIAIAAYEWGAGQSKQVVYGTDDGHIHELQVTVNGSWAHTDLTQQTGATAAKVV